MSFNPPPTENNTAAAMNPMYGCEVSNGIAANSKKPPAVNPMARVIKGRKPNLSAALENNKSVIMRTM